MPSDAIPDEDDENWEVAYCEQGEKEKNLWDAAFIRITGKNFEDHG